ncbi:peptidoglycan-binding protein [Nocardioides baekrokdamisoli]|uniref:Peptidoglycan-binding protein n=1 Tax=Nocardioides baekrokdamisoli TaxID=1804624 RepID=A0A3G9ITG3_9ACTN|nr:peptidoglycan-binding protein [Nocardioides baekrokdamisoli]
MATAAVVRQTLTDHQALSGVVGFGPTTPLNNQMTGTFTWLPQPGAVVGNGQQLYRVNDTPVTDMTGTMPAYRAMAADMTGPDIAQLNASLRALGYLYGNPGDRYTAQTTAAVKAWQKAIGVEATGTVALGQVVFTPAAVRIATVTPTLGAPAAPGAPAFTTSDVAAQVTVTTDAANRRYFKIGESVTVGLPDGSSVHAKIVSIGPIVSPAQGSNNGPTVSAQAALTDPKVAAAFQAATVDVTINTAEHANVLTVPVTALLALREGGYAVAVDDTTGRHLIGVSVGLIVGDTVEVSAKHLSPGMKVEVGST